MVTEKRGFRIILAVLLMATLFSGGIYAGRRVFLNKLNIFLKELMETSFQKGVKIDTINYAPFKGISIKGVAFYKDKLYEEKIFDIAHLFIKFSLAELITRKTFSPTVNVDNLRLKNFTANGYFGFSAKPVKKMDGAEGAPGGIEQIWFRDIVIKNEFFAFGKGSGHIDIKRGSIKSTDVTFVLNEEPCKLRFEIKSAEKEPSTELEISSPRINLSSKIVKKDDLYKIERLAGKFFDSPFEFNGEFSSFDKGWDSISVLLYGKADLDIKDIAYFATHEAKKRIEALNLNGTLNNSIFFKGTTKDIQSWEADIKSGSRLLKIKNFKFDGFEAALHMKNGKISIPTFNAYPYNGILSSSAEIDISGEYILCALHCKLGNIDINSLLSDTELRDRNIEGLLFSEFTLKGNAKNIGSINGAGTIFIKDANLGPMPLLAPLLGNTYGYLRKIFPELKRIDIRSASADFAVGNRKVSTDNLVLWGDAVSVHAKGFIDFDKNLDFAVENKFVEPEEEGLSDWQESLQKTIVRFGKMISRARLTGTLRKPKWKFQYTGGLENVFKEEARKIFKEIFE